MSNQLIPFDVVGQICSARDETVRKLYRFLDLVEEAKEARDQALHRFRHAMGKPDCEWPTFEEAPTGILKELDDKMVEQFRLTLERIVDTKVWGAIVDRTELRQLMDAEAKEELKEKLKYRRPEEHYSSKEHRLITQREIDETSLPPITVDNVYDVLEGFAAQAGDIMKRGVVISFKKLESRYRSNNGVKFGHRGSSSKTGGRIVIPYAWEGWMWRRSARDAIIDVERAFYVLDKKKPPKNGQSIIDLVDNHPRAEVVGHDFEDGYFRVRIFKNGNAHLWFLRQDLVDEANRIIAESEGPVLGRGPVGKTGEESMKDGHLRPHAPNFGEFFTPPAAVDFIRQHFDVSHVEDKYALEPSAGRGALVEVLQGLTREVDCVEIQSKNTPYLERMLNMRGRVYRADFLEWDRQYRNEYPIILMNPPFNREGGEHHVYKALRHLDTTGDFVLGAIMGQGARYGKDSGSKAFRRALKLFCLKNGARSSWADMPPGSFKASGTSVETVFLLVTTNGVER